MYGITCADYWLMFEIQEGACGACGKHQQRPALVLDHDHDPPYEIRGLLCTHCNRSLTRAIARYLANPPARKVGPFLVPTERAEVARKRRDDVRKRRTKARATAKTDQQRTTPEPTSNLDKLRTMTQGGA